MTDTRVRVFGIRHHGPGSARALLRALETMEPDAILVEGPSDADDQLFWLGHTEMAPPVALIVYRPDQPSRAAFFPFAEFSPEYQAILFALKRNISVAFMDLPQSCMLATGAKLSPPEAETLQAMAQVAGYAGYERWWNQLVEQRRNTSDLFAAVMELMVAARDLPAQRRVAEIAPELLLAEQREACMRERIRSALSTGYRRIAVVCGAWHGPALVDPKRFADGDRELLADLPFVVTESAWAPWTYGRLATFAGYGAGVPSPGWYQHLWETNDRPDGASDDFTAGSVSIWLMQIAALLRGEGTDISAAHVIEAVRLAESLAALRGESAPGLAELDDAARTVMCGGREKPMQLIRQRMVVGERMGSVPSDAPMTPLQRDLAARQRAVRLFPEPEKTLLALDLRIERHLDRSCLLHRLALLGIDWGTLVSMRRGRGTYGERWTLEWRPELVTRVVEASLWGNTVGDAAAGYARHLADEADSLPQLTKLLDSILLADLGDLVAQIMQRIEDEGVLHADVIHLMEALPPLVRVLRYGSVRRLDHRSIRHAVDTILTRIALGLPQVCRDANDDAASELVTHLEQTHILVGALRATEHSERWAQALIRVADDEHANGLLGGRAVRLLFDGGHLSRDDIGRRLRLALGAELPDADALMQSGFWLDGFLRGADQLLLHDQGLWHLIDEWVLGLHQERFLEVLPLLRRAFSSFREDARDELLTRVRTQRSAPQVEVTRPLFDQSRALEALPLLADILGVSL